MDKKIKLKKINKKTASIKIHVKRIHNLKVKQKIYIIRRLIRPYMNF